MLVGCRASAPPDVLPAFALVPRTPVVFVSGITGSKLRALATAPGDGHASVSSQLWLSPQESSAMPRPPYYVEGGHFELIRDPATRRHLLEALGAAPP
jgi:hypothetical protein